MDRHELFLVDSYCKEKEAEITDISELGLKLDQVIFYPRGGGQPEDRGIIIHGGNEFKVKKINRTKHGIYLSVDNQSEILDTVNVNIGDKVIQRIDWEYRYQLMQHHTALHILSAVVWNKFEAKVTGGTIYHDKARLDFDLDEFSQDLALGLVDEVNRIIDEDHKVSISFVDRQKAETDPDLIRTKINLLPKSISEIRLVQIGTVDIQADGGLHVHSTGEIGRVELVNTENKGKGRKRISIATIT